MNHPNHIHFRSEEHTSELQSRETISYPNMAAFYNNEEQTLYVKRDVGDSVAVAPVSYTHLYSEKAEAGKAIIKACKQMNSPDPIPLGKYRGFETELLFNLSLIHI